MKKTISFIILLLFTIGYAAGQEDGIRRTAAPTEQIRVTTPATPFGKNLPMGTTLFCRQDSSYWVARTGVPSTGTLGTTKSSWTLLGGAGLTAYYIVENYEMTMEGDSLSEPIDLIGLPIPGSVSVDLNGMALRDNEYRANIITSNPLGPYCQLVIRMSVFPYDKVRTSYKYTTLSTNIRQ